jgi:hypothetical protein
LLRLYLQLSGLLEADIKSASGSIRSRNSRSKKKNHERSGRTDLVTYDVFKRMYWSHLPRSSTKGLCMSFTPLSPQALTPAIKHHLSHLANFLVWLLIVPRFLSLRASDSFQAPSRDQRKHWTTQTALSTEMLMRTSGIRTK